MKIGFKFKNYHVWSMEELTELQRIFSSNEYNWNNIHLGDILYTSSDTIFHDFKVVRKEDNVIVLEEV